MPDAPRTLTLRTADGVTLVADDRGPQSDPCPVICLPGLTRNARDFTAIAERLSQPGRLGPARRVIVLESRGRGRSGRAAPSTYTLPQELNDLQAALRSWHVREADFLGTSRGGLLTMLLAMAAPDTIRRAALNDIGPRIEPTGLGRIAESVGRQMEFESFDALADALEASLGPQFPRLVGKDWQRLARQLASHSRTRGDGAASGGTPGETHSAAGGSASREEHSEIGDGGKVAFDYDEELAAPFRETNASAAPPDFWPAFAALRTKRTLVIRGALSDLLSAATVEAMRRQHPGLRTFVAVNEGHAPLLWNRASLEALQRFFNEPVTH